MKILILGGSKFMGLELVIRLIELIEKFNLEIYIVNRGRSYWNYSFYNLIKLQPKIKHFIADREDSVEFEKILELVLNSQDNIIFDHIVDFSCYRKCHSRQLLTKLQNSFKNYIFISTDSTYNASEIALIRSDEYFTKNENPNLILETDIMLLEGENNKHQYKHRDSYGYNKIKCEMEIKRIFKYYDLNSKGCTYIFLRLPDVIGTYDESLRIWNYIEWIKLSYFKKLELDNIDLIRKLSFVEKDDVVQLILKIILEYDKFSSKLNDEFNLSFDESLTLLEFLKILSGILNINEDFYEIKENPIANYYPSVTIGAIDNSKAKKVLEFNPSPLIESLKKCVLFFEYVLKNRNEYKTEYDEFLEYLPKKIKQEFQRIYEVDY